MASKNRVVAIPAVGYAFLPDAGSLAFCKVGADDRVVTVNGGQVIDVDPSMLLWYTKNRITSARLRMGKEAGNLVPFTPDLAAALAERNVLPRTTADHILHMLTAGHEKVLGRDFTRAELADKVNEAGKFYVRILDAWDKATAAAAA